MMSTPPPSNELLAAISGMKPVRTRAPRRALAWVLAVWSLYGAVPIIAFRIRPDLPYLPTAWLFLVGGAWLAGFIVPVGFALLPRRGQVLPDGARAALSALVAAAGLILLGAIFPREAPGHSIVLPLHIGIRNCGLFAMIFSILPVTVGMIAVRRAVPVGAWRIGAALGAASGALAGFVLHLLCPVGGPGHLALAHGGAVGMCALVGALAASRVFRS